MVIKMEGCPIRAHHGMCLAFFQGKGYGDDFVRHMFQVKQQLEENPKIRLIQKTDRICDGCPNCHNGICNSYVQTENYDRQVLNYCGLKEGNVLYWKEFSELVKIKIIDAGKRKEICGDCEWSDLCNIRQ